VLHYYGGASVLTRSREVEVEASETTKANYLRLDRREVRV